MNHNFAKRKWNDWVSCIACISTSLLYGYFIWRSILNQWFFNDRRKFNKYFSLLEAFHQRPLDPIETQTSWLLKQVLCSYLSSLLLCWQSINSWHKTRADICPCHHPRPECRSFASGVNFSINNICFVFLSLKLLKSGEI